MRAKQLNHGDKSSPPAGASSNPADPAGPLKTQARRRLIGAAVLALTAVVLVPLVLDTKPRAWSDEINIKIPSKDSKFESAIKPAAANKEPPKEAPAVAAEPAPTSAAVAASTAPPPPPPPAMPAPAAAPPPSPIKPAEKAKPAAAKIIVQAGAFTSDEKVKNLEQIVRKAGFSPYSEEIATRKGTVIRVRFAVASVDAANKAVAKLGQAGQAAKIITP